MHGSRPVVRVGLAGLLGVVAAACLSVPDSQDPPEWAANQAGTTTPAASTDPDRRAERDALMTELGREAGVRDERVLAALRRVPRHRFVPDAVRDAAYDDRPLPIGHGQTISAPSIVVLMTAAVAPKATDRCLEIGTGSGYQAAVLAELCARVHSIEYLEPLARFAERNLRAAGYGPDRVAVRTGDGYEGWPDAAPFDVVVVTAAPPQVPAPLLAQLDVGGRLVVPVGQTNQVQRLELVRRLQPGSGPDAFERRLLAAVQFVPFVGKAQEPRR